MSDPSSEEEDALRRDRALEGDSRALIDALREESLGAARTARIRAAIGVGIGAAAAGAGASAHASTVPTGTVPTGTVPTGTVPTGTVPAGTVPAAMGAAGAAKISTGLVVAKWVGVGVLVVSTGALSVPSVRGRVVDAWGTREAPAPAVSGWASPRMAGSQSALAAQATSTALGATGVIATGEPIPATELPRVPSASRHEVGQGGVSDVREELEALEVVRRGLRDGDLAGARTALARYRVSNARGVLLAEADALEVELLAREGRSDEARARARAFVAAHPGSPHAPRVERVARGEGP